MATRAMELNYVYVFIDYSYFTQEKQFQRH